MPYSRSKTFLIFFIIPAIVYFSLITQFTFDIFGYDYLWKAYNSLALSILDGRLDVPYEAIGRESFFYKGNVYFYYGMFSVIGRLIAYPFINLSEVPLAKLSVWIMITLAAASIQYALLYYSRSPGRIDKWSKADIYKLYLLSLTIWFASGYTIIVQKAPIWHEPYAAMFMLSTLFIVLIWRDLFWNGVKKHPNLVLYAGIAALSVHTRQTVAISLYLIVLLLIIYSAFYQASASEKGEISAGGFLIKFIKIGFIPGVILIASGLLFLFLNYIRFDDFFSLSKAEYGFFRGGEGLSERVCSKFQTGVGRFEIGRILPNLFYYLTGLSQYHANIIDNLGLGYVRKEYPGFSLALLWSCAGITLITTLYLLLSNKSGMDKAASRMYLVIFLILLIGPVIMLSYTAIAYRYTADLWLPFSFTLLFFAKFWLSSSSTDIRVASFINHKIFMRIFTLFLLLNLSFGGFMYGRYQDHQISGTVNGQPD
jgi:hypothetical protein